MDAPELIKVVLSSLLGTGGLAALLTAHKAYKTRKALPAEERRAVARVASDVDALTKYWMNELQNVRDELARERRENRRRAARDAERIDQLEEHIWLKRQPPPPPPKTNHRKEET